MYTVFLDVFFRGKKRHFVAGVVLHLLYLPCYFLFFGKCVMIRIESSQIWLPQHCGKKGFDLMKKSFSEYAYSSFLGAILSAAIGVVLLIWPSLSGRLLCYGMGAALAIYGVYRISSYFMRDAVTAMLRRDLSMGLALLAGAIFFLFWPDLVISLLPVLFGLLLLLGATREAQGAFDLMRMEDAYWYISLIVALVLAILGVVILLNPFSTALVLMRFIGVSLILQSVSQVVFARLLARRQKVYYPQEETPV